MQVKLTSTHDGRSGFCEDHGCVADVVYDQDIGAMGVLDNGANLEIGKRTAGVGQSSPLEITW